MGAQGSVELVFGRDARPHIVLQRAISFGLSPTAFREGGFVADVNPAWHHGRRPKEAGSDGAVAASERASRPLRRKTHQAFGAPTSSTLPSLIVTRRSILAASSMLCVAISAATRLAFTSDASVSNT